MRAAPLLQHPVRQGGKAFSQLRLDLRVDIGHDHAGPCGPLGDDFAPGIDHHAVAVGLAAVRVPSPLGRREHPGEVLDGAGAEQRLPVRSGISGDLIFEGRSMRVAASRAAVLGVKASSVSADIPDLFHGNLQLGIEIRAEDQTDDFLRFIAQSPVTRALDGITESIRATGAGRLALQLDIPISNPAGLKVAGSYQIVDNELRADSDAPFSHVNGQIEFTESGVTARTLTAQLLGGPATISVANRADGTI